MRWSNSDRILEADKPKIVNQLANRGVYSVTFDTDSLFYAAADHMSRGSFKIKLWRKNDTSDFDCSYHYTQFQSFMQSYSKGDYEDQRREPMKPPNGI